MTHSILLIVEKPIEADHEANDMYQGCITNLTNFVSQNKDIEVLSENVLLLPLDYNLNAVSPIVPCLLGLPYKYIIFDEDIEWHEVPKQV